MPFLSRQQLMVPLHHIRDANIQAELAEAIASAYSSFNDDQDTEIYDILCSKANDRIKRASILAICNEAR